MFNWFSFSDLKTINFIILFDRKKTPLVGEPEESCTHDEQHEFHRVDSKRFSKRFIKKSTSGKLLTV